MILSSGSEALSRHFAYSHLRRGDEHLAELLDRADWVGMPTVLLGELVLGFTVGSRRERNERELAAFLKHPRVATLPVDRDVAKIWGDLVARLRSAGTPVSPG